MDGKTTTEGRGKFTVGTGEGDVMAVYPDFEQLCGYGSVTGIGGANCRH